MLVDLSDVFGHDEDKIARWLDTPKIGLGGATPRGKMDTFKDIWELEDFISALMDGAFV